MSSIPVLWMVRLIFLNSSSTDTADGSILSMPYGSLLSSMVTYEVEYRVLSLGEISVGKWKNSAFITMT